MTKELIMELEDRLYKAIIHADIPTLEELLHDDLLFNLPSGQTITKTMDIETYRQEKMNIESLVPSDYQISQLSDDTCIVTVTIALKGDFEGRPLAGKYRYLRVWKSHGNNYKVFAGSAIQIS
ncbi:nuclear transport factor 2 family protein [Sphingobacterium sp. LRF_L2]|uniref:nuclear transport factor 2 family protein n=1 Tax=Sphingobacterium sp. LRF_L2 TaxID=3369421 RepID=UPI003F5E099D